MIRGRRIRNAAPHFAHVRAGSTISLGVAAQGRQATLARIGFSASLEPGEAVLPFAFGPVSAFNAHGKHIVHKDRPKERAYRLIEWTWKEWHGRYEEERTEIRELGYDRYPRTFIPPPSLELSLASSMSGDLLVCTPPSTYAGAQNEQLLHAVNLLLEIFGECEIFDDARSRVIRATMRRLNWQVLPQGRWPWIRLRHELDPVVQIAAAGNRSVIEWRFQSVNQYEPSFVAVGQGGFRGYVVFAFPERSLFVLECVYSGNATYVLGQNWESVAQLSKAQILNEALHVHRIIHRRSWSARIDSILRVPLRST